MLQNRVAVVSGSSRGAGRAIAELFAEAGALVVLNGRDRAKGRRALEEMELGDRAVFIEADVCTRPGCESLIDGALTTWGRVDILVNNAGGSANPAPIAHLTDETLETVMRWNFWSTFWCTRLALGDMIPRRHGRIINMSSLEGKAGRPVNSAYVSAKHAVHGLTKSCAAENGEFGITVNAICPGIMRTDIVEEVGTKIAAEQGLTLEQFLELRSGQAATGAPTQVADVARTALFLASDAAAGITGSLISVDGGTAPF